MTQTQKNLKTLMTKTYLKTFLAILVSGVFSLILYSTPAIAQPIFAVLTMGGRPILSFIFVMALLIFMMTKLQTTTSKNTALFLFVLLSMFFGTTLTVYLMYYGVGFVFKIFFVTSLYFLILAIYSFATEKDFTKMGNVLFGALIALIVVSLVNLFLGMPMLDTILAFATLVIFTFYTIYDHQQIVNEAIRGDRNHDNFELVSYSYAMALYLDFLNLLQALLRIFGNK